MKLFTSLLVIAIAVPLLAQPLDSRPDGMGVFFDETASQPCLADPIPFASYTAYLLLTHPSADAVSRWTVRLTESGVAARIGTWYLGGVDILPDDTWDVSYAVPMVPADNVLALAWLDFVWVGGGENRLGFAEIPGDIVCGYWDGLGVYRDCVVWTDDPVEIAVMGSGDLCEAAPTEAMGWGSVKGLF